MSKKFTLPELPYDFSALEPVISGEIMELHHQKHHNAYVNNLNIALEKYEQAEANEDLTQMISLQQAIRFNGGGHINHSIFWTNLAPNGAGGGELAGGELKRSIEACWGSLDQFIQKFNSIAGPLQGSGWCWLGYCNATRRLVIEPCVNQDPLFATKGVIPLLGIDVWEHAYYLQYKNVRPDYLKAIWGVVNWQNVEERYHAALGTEKAAK